MKPDNCSNDDFDACFLFIAETFVDLNQDYLYVVKLGQIFQVFLRSNLHNCFFVLRV